MSKEKYDLIIIGVGPAGLTASIYASRYKIKHLMIGKLFGGLATEAHLIYNWPTEKGISGVELMAKMEATARSLGGEIKLGEVEGIGKRDDYFLVKTASGEELLARTVLIACGTQRRKLNLENEDKLVGRGISYCATCDAPLFKQKIVAVVGGGDGANTASLYLAKIAKHVYQIYRQKELRGEPSWIGQVLKNSKIEMIYNTQVVGFFGDKKLERIVLDQPYRGSTELKVDGLFLEIGAEPNLKWLFGLGVATDDKGYIKVGRNQATNISGLWAAGDITDSSNHFHQIITACSEGAIAVQNIFDFLQLKNK